MKQEQLFPAARANYYRSHGLRREIAPASRQKKERPPTSRNKVRRERRTRCNSQLFSLQAAEQNTTRQRATVAKQREVKQRCDLSMPTEPHWVTTMAPSWWGALNLALWGTGLSTAAADDWRRDSGSINKVHLSRPILSAEEFGRGNLENVSTSINYNRTQKVYMLLLYRGQIYS